MHFLEKVLPEVEYRIRKQFLNELVPNYYSKKKIQSDLIMFKKSWKSDFQLKIQFSGGGGQGFFVKKFNFF